LPCSNFIYFAIMYKNLQFVFITVLSGILLFSCVKKTSKKDVEEYLKTAMGLYLNHSPRVDTSQVKFNVLEVVYFEDKTFYRCEFKVNMKQKINDQIKDTTGAMGANITKDFKNVTRRF
jgi:hypothetical protein